MRPESGTERRNSLANNRNSTKSLIKKWNNPEKLSTDPVSGGFQVILRLFIPPTECDTINIVKLLMDCMNFNESLKLKVLVSGHSVNNAGDIRCTGWKTACADPETVPGAGQGGEGEGGARHHPQEEHRRPWLAGGGYMTQAELGQTQRDRLVIHTSTPMELCIL